MLTSFKKHKRAAAIVCAASLGLILVAIALQAAASHAPEFYAAALAADPLHERASSDAMLENATALVNVSHRDGPWYAVVTEEQINGWLAVDLVENYAELLPPTVADPRVHIEPGCATIACSYQSAALSAVMSVKFDVYLAEPRVVALRIRAARAGALPMPIKPIVDHIVRTAERLNLFVQWRQADGDPVALITLPAAPSKAAYRLESVKLREGQLYLAGRTEGLSSPDGPTPSVTTPQPDVATLPDESRKTQ